MGVGVGVGVYRYLSWRVSFSGTCGMNWEEREGVGEGRSLGLMRIVLGKKGGPAGGELGWKGEGGSVWGKGKEGVFDF